MSSLRIQNQHRFFRLSRDDAVINGFYINYTGHFNVLANMKIGFSKLFNLFETSHSTTGNEVEDYFKGVNILGQQFVIGKISLPRKPSLRDLQIETKLTRLFSTLVEEISLLGSSLQHWLG
ncbi:hypothetical protein G9P44_004297 [Scheffersomyces stipitis]|nr:hypothetical protein G9P44_004297 [Scheffersomyces stipitis]